MILAVSLAAATTTIQYYNTASGLFDDPFARQKAPMATSGDHCLVLRIVYISVLPALPK